MQGGREGEGPIKAERRLPGRDGPQRVHGRPLRYADTARPTDTRLKDPPRPGFVR